MKTSIAVFFLIFFSITFQKGANATTLTYWYGDNDGFGAGYNVGQEISFADTWDLTPGFGDPDNTDRWTTIIDLPLTWNYTFSEMDINDINGLGENASVSLEIVSAGQGLHGFSSVFLNDAKIGDLTRSESQGKQKVVKDTFYFPVTDLIESIGKGQISISVVTAAVEGKYKDNWMMDYSKLTFSNDIVSSIPEPTTFVLLGTGLLTCLFKKKRKS